MADEAAENVGGISVEIGAAHTHLQADLEAIDQAIEAWAARERTVSVRVQSQGLGPGGQAATEGEQPKTTTAIIGREPENAPPPIPELQRQVLALQLKELRQPTPKSAQGPAPVVVGPSAASKAQAERAQPALIQAINAELEKTGERYNPSTGEAEKVEAAPTEHPATVQPIIPTASPRPAPVALPSVGPVELHANTQELSAALALLNEIQAATEKLSSTQISVPVAAQAGNAPETPANTPRRPRRTPAAGAPPNRPPAPPVAVGGEEEDEEAGIRPQRLDTRPRIVNATLARMPRIVVTPAQKQAEKNAIRSAAMEQKRDRARTLQELSYEAEREGPGGPTSSTLIGGPRRTPEQIEQFRQQEAQRANAQAPRAPRQAPSVAAIVPPAPPIDAIERQRRQLLASLEAGRGRGGIAATTGIRGIGEEDLARRAEQRIASAESSRVAAGRTARTTASGFGGQFLFGGPARQQVEAVARQSEAEQNLLRIRRLANDPKIIRDARAYRSIIEEQTVAENTLAKATEKVQSFASAGTALRSLAAVTVAGAAFGLALQGVNVAISTVVPALGDAIDQAAGFGATSTKVTGALAQQTVAMRGNVGAVLATAEAQAGLSTSAADVVNSQIQMTTQIKAGALAAAQAGGLFRAAIGANQESPQGLTSGFGGILGGPILAQQLGGGAGLAETIKSSFGDIAGATLGTVRGPAAPQGRFGGQPYIVPQAPERLAQLAGDRVALETTYNDAAKRGAGALGVASSSVVHFAQITEAQAQAVQDSNLPDELKDLASKSKEGLLDASGNLITAYKQATDGLKQVGVGLSIPDAETLGRIQLFAEQQRQRESAASLSAIQSQQAFVRPSIVAQAERQQQYSLGTQIPAQAGLQALANPLQPIGTGIKASGAAEQAKITAGQQQSVELQKQLNDYYAQGKQILIDTYKVPPQLIASVEAVGKQIAATQAGISNEQAAYQVAQYNFQLLIARRTLSDIGGLVGKNLGAGQSYLGVLEHQNLLLSRQAQQLQFALSQRQINFQAALAGFQAPGVTPEERQARIAEAQTEASFAQKQLDIQRQMFGNQVQIVDISNLRQGADLVRQIGLLTQGRQVTVDTHLAEERLIRLQQLQQKNVAQVGTYLAKVDNLASAAFSEIQQLEAAAGKAMTGIAVQVLRQFGILINGLNDAVSGHGTTGGTGSGGKYQFAAGGVLSTNGPTQIGTNAIAGEAAGETLVILSHPRAVSDVGGSSGSTMINLTFGDTYVRSESDIHQLVREVTRELGREASLKGLRGVG